MERIGLAASKIAKGNLLLYNSLVVLLAFLLSLLMFIIAGAAVLFALIVLGYLLYGLLPQEIGKEWMQVISTCMMTLTVVVVIMNFLALIRNIKIRRDSSA